VISASLVPIAESPICWVLLLVGHARAEASFGLTSYWVNLAEVCFGHTVSNARYPHKLKRLGRAIADQKPVNFKVSRALWHPPQTQSLPWVKLRRL
jgi:hypothetical protein